MQGRLAEISDFTAGAVRKFRRDLIICGVLALIVGVGSFYLTGKTAPILLNENDVWFGADTQRVFHDMSEAGARHYRAKVHPLFVLLTQPIVALLHAATGLGLPHAVRLLNALFAAVWISLLFALLRILGCRRLDATLFTLLAAVSASAIFWLSVIETYVLGSISILSALISVELVSRWKRPALWMAIVSAFTLSVTVTNWMTGLLATVVSFGARRALVVTMSAFCLVAVLWGVQKLAYPSCKFFLGAWEEGHYINSRLAGGPLRSVRSIIFHTVVMPTVPRKNDQISEIYPVAYLTAQPAPVTNGSSLQLASRACWLLLLGMGAAGVCIALQKRSKICIALAGTLAGQIFLHSIYGDEIFLYSLHWAPLLVAVAALGTLTRFRPAVLVVTAALILTAGVNNFSQLSIAIKSLPEQSALKAKYFGQ